MSTAFTTGPALFHSQNWSVSQEWPSRSLPMATASDSGRPVLPVARPARQSCARAAKVVRPFISHANHWCYIEMIKKKFSTKIHFFSTSI